MKDLIYTVSQDAKNTISLEVSGQPMICPFRNPFIVPGRMQGTVDIKEKTCCSLCPHFTFSPDELTVQLGCSGNVQSIPVTPRELSPTRPLIN